MSYFPPRNLRSVEVSMLGVATMVMATSVIGQVATDVALRQTSAAEAPVNLGSGWFSSPLFGYYFRGLYPFVYAAETEEWIYASGESEVSGFFKRLNSDHWGWSAPDYYPYYWNLQSNQWAGVRMQDAATLVGMVAVDAGTILEGRLSASKFAIGKYEVTFSEWDRVRAWAFANGYQFTQGLGCKADHPVHSVSWYDALIWCNAKSEMEGHEAVYTVDGVVLRNTWLPSGARLGANDAHRVHWNPSARGFRLPTQTEWEFAARGGSATNGFMFSGSNAIESVGWAFETSEGAQCRQSQWSTVGTWPVGLKGANEIGIHDMSGNVQEWTWDPVSSIQSDRYARGGSYANSGFRTGFVADCRVTSAETYRPDVISNRVGFRIAADPALFGNQTR